MLFKKSKSDQPIVSLVCRDNKYYIETSIPVEIIEDNIVFGTRLIKLNSSRNHIHMFMVKNADRKKNKESSKLRGIILKPRVTKNGVFID